MTAVAYRFTNNTINEVMHPWRILYDTAFGTLGTVAVDAVGFDDVIGNVAGTFDLSPTRSNQLAAGLTFATLSALERATMKSLGANSGLVY